MPSSAGLLEAPASIPVLEYMTYTYGQKSQDRGILENHTLPIPNILIRPAGKKKKKKVLCLLNFPEPFAGTETETLIRRVIFKVQK